MLLKEAGELTDCAFCLLAGSVRAGVRLEILFSILRCALGLRLASKCELTFRLPPATSLGRHCTRRSLFRQHACQAHSWHLRQHPRTLSCPLLLPVNAISPRPHRSSQTSLLRALPPFVPVLIFPAMNTHMYSHPLTAKQLKSVEDELGYQVHGPVAKTLACGDVGELSPSCCDEQVLYTEQQACLCRDRRHD